MMLAGMTAAERRYATQSASMDSSEQIKAMGATRALEYKSRAADPLHQNTSSYRSRRNDTDLSADNDGGSSFYQEFMAGSGGSGDGGYDDGGGDCAQS